MQRKSMKNAPEDGRERESVGVAPAPEARSQLEKFVETARALGCDEDKGRFEVALGKVAHAKPNADFDVLPRPPKGKSRRSQTK